MTLSERIRKRLGELGVTQAQLAERAAISLNLVESLLAGKRRDPRLSTALKLAAALQVRLSWLAGEQFTGKRIAVRMSESDDAEFARMWNDGANYHDFVRHFGINRWSIAAIRKRLGLPSRKSGRPQREARQ